MGHTETLVQECGVEKGVPPVWIAAQNGYTETVRALVKECGADASTADKAGHTPVWIAGDCGLTETVLALVQGCGADASTADNDGCTPVLAAAHNGHTETGRVLVQECSADALVLASLSYVCNGWFREFARGF